MGLESNQGFIAGRPAMGKRPLPTGASAAEHAALLKRAVYEIDRREKGEASQAADYVVFINEAAVLAQFPADDQLRDLVDVVRTRGPAQGVTMRP